MHRLSRTRGDRHSKHASSAAARRGPAEHLVEVDGASICDQVGSPKVLNIALLAAAVDSGTLGITREELENAVRGRVHPRFHEMNLNAIALVCA